MKREREDVFIEDTGQVIYCPRCRKAHYSHAAVMDEYISCGCGLSFYAFSCKGLQIIMPPDEAGYEPIARELRRLVVATGRCTDIPPELYQDEDGQLYFGLDADSAEKLELALAEFQKDVFDNSYITKDMVYSICESFEDGHDVELRKQKTGVDVIRLIKKKLPAPDSKRLTRHMAEDKNTVQLAIPNSGIMTRLQGRQTRLRQ